MHNLNGSLDNIIGNTRWAKLQQLEFHAILDKGIFYGWISDKVEYFYSYNEEFFI